MVINTRRCTHLQIDTTEMADIGFFSTNRFAYFSIQRDVATARFYFEYRVCRVMHYSNNNNCVRIVDEQRPTYIPITRALRTSKINTVIIAARVNSTRGLFRLHVSL